MADGQQTAPGGYYSGKNRIPTIGQFIERLDKDKSDRDKQIDAQRKTQKQGGGEVQAHHNEAPRAKSGQKTVTDPTTGKQVVIEDVDKDMMENAKNPVLSVPNANLGKDTPVKTDSSQSNPEYKKNQDVTAPPDPVAEGSTSDVPIHGEKTNILFHPTPSVSYEPTFASLEKKAGFMCIAIFVATIVVGNIFGGALKGLIPLAMCLASGVWLWMKEVVRSGREVEWSSEKERGETVSTIDTLCDTPLLTRVGHCQPPPRIGRVDEHPDVGRLGSHQPRLVSKCCGYS